MENATKVECDVAILYEYSCLWVPPHDLLANTEKNIILDNTLTKSRLSWKI
jgi:hypothetical protein